MVKLVSCDTSTSHSGMALFVDGKLTEWVLHEPTGKYAEDRIKIMNRDIYNQLEKWNPDIVIAETPQGRGGNVKLAKQFGQILGSLITWCGVHDSEFIEQNPSWWRKWCEGFEQGGLEREDLKLMSIAIVKEKYGITATDDVCDAVNLGDAYINYCKVNGE